MENILNLRYPIIASLIGCVLPVESSGQREFKTVRLYAVERSLVDVLSNPPAWWTPTVKAKAVVGIALGLRFAHDLGLLHGAVKVSNMLFDADRPIQIADFSQTRLETGESNHFRAKSGRRRRTFPHFHTFFSKSRLVALALTLPLRPRIADGAALIGGRSGELKLLILRNARLSLAVHLGRDSILSQHRVRLFRAGRPRRPGPGSPWANPAAT
jgi:serine/threonine protein kinase